MYWTVNDWLYHRFLKWHLKCENILECELAALPERQQCKKVIAWFGDFGMDQYVSWGLPSDQLTLQLIWGKFEDFASHNQMKCVQGLTSSQASNKVIGALMNGIMQYKLSQSSQIPP